MMDLMTSGTFQFVDAKPINVRCPNCGHVGTFSKIKQGNSSIPDSISTTSTSEKNNLGATRPIKKQFGMRLCPNLECSSVLFFTEIDEQRICYPPEVIDFDSSNLPDNILSSLEEAIKCHSSGCYRAAALMIRRTLEELCQDKNAKGKNLKERLSNISDAIIPEELLNAADELRLLGNDAAHVEAKDYDTIGAEEAEIAIELAKELLKAVYQYANLLSRLQAMKKPKTPPP